MTLLSHERTAALRLVTRNRHGTWSRHVRSFIESQLVQLQREAETEEERRDVRRLWDMMNDICAKHKRRSGT
jgi:hypothetical protein